MVVLLNEDKKTPLVAFNILYNVGSKFEEESKTGLAHLFEHLMFSGTKQVPDFDYYTQITGGENNAFTNSDITNFYITLPAQNIETAFWLEADRMTNLTLSKEKFENEKRVVIEEFKETSLNVPYGDMWHHLAGLSYKKHPYKWPTIGKKIEHIENFDLDDIRGFYKKYYHPGNAILSISGNFDEKNILKLAQKWFGSIDKKGEVHQKLPQEPIQLKMQNKILKESVPSNAYYLAFHICGRKDKTYYSHDLLSDILGRGRSSRLFQNLVKEKEIFSEIHAYITGNIDPGLLVIEGNFSDKTNVSNAIESVKEELKKIKSKKIDNYELDKLKNKIENEMAFAEISILNKAINLAQYELIGDVTLINKQVDLYNEVTTEEILKESNIIFQEENCSQLIYLKK